MSRRRGRGFKPTDEVALLGRRGEDAVEAQLEARDLVLPGPEVVSGLAVSHESATNSSSELDHGAETRELEEGRSELQDEDVDRAVLLRAPPHRQLAQLRGRA